MKKCGECFTFSPNDARFCIECSNPFGATGATERLTSYPQSSMGCHVYKMVTVIGPSDGSQFIPMHSYRFLIGTLGSGSANSFIIGDIGI